MAKIPSPIHDDKAVPASVSKPTETAAAAAAVAESAVAHAARKPRAVKGGSAAATRARPAEAAVAPKTKAAAPAKKARTAPAAKNAKAAPAARKAKAAPAAEKAKGAVVEAPVAAAPAAPAKPAKAHKPKLVRDSFTIPKDEYQVLDALKSRALGLGQHVRKSELLRAGIQALNAMNDRALLKAVGAVPTLKTGRPKKG